MKDDDKFAAQMVEHLEASEVDTDVTARLRAMRAEAVQAVDRKTMRPAIWLLPAGGVLASALLLTFLLRANDNNVLPLMDDAEFAAAIELELLEDLELLAWMEESVSDAS